MLFHFIPACVSSKMPPLVRMVLMLFLLEGSLCYAEAPPPSVADNQKRIEQLYDQLLAFKQQLIQGVADAETKESDERVLLKQHADLAKKYLFDTPLWQQEEAHLLAFRNSAAQSNNAKPLAMAPTALTFWQTQADRAEHLQKTFEAEKTAEITRRDSKMYFDMRVRAPVPPKTLKAYGLMGLAKQTRDQGDFEKALSLWAQAEEMVKESFNEHIAKMAEFADQNAKIQTARLTAIKQKLDTLLLNYFSDIPAGEFDMGNLEGNNDEKPLHKVKITAFKLGKTEVTFELYDLCVEANKCTALPADESWGRGRRPVINVSFDDIVNEFLPWLNYTTGQTFRLPTEAEWEYAARAGAVTVYAWGDHITCDLARFDGGLTSVCSASTPKRKGPAEVQTYKANAFGLFDMHGNVWEWVQDCWFPNYQEAPNDGSARFKDACNVRVLRGGAWDYDGESLRSANRHYFLASMRKSNFGFRLAVSK